MAFNLTYRTIKVGEHGSMPKELRQARNSGAASPPVGSPNVMNRNVKFRGQAPGVNPRFSQKLPLPQKADCVFFKAQDSIQTLDKLNQSLGPHSKDGQNRLAALGAKRRGYV